ncbi:hypothetical protein ACRC6Q_08365 [Planococcus sp. SE5232]|uniref:hypothetical protein n=1 Tax=unclassified Planococcus (in: firmicutes) TaxID=2662419 RepID=UPI003D6A43A1
MKTPVGQRELKTPQERSDEEAEAEPMESEVAGPLGDYALLYILVRLCLQSEASISSEIDAFQHTLM